MTTAAVIVRLRGGLGNQMFQYATAFALAQRHGREVRLDLRECPPGNGPPQLLRWQVPARQINRAQAWRHTRLTLALARRSRGFARLLHCHAERGLRFDPTLEHRTPPLLLDGYFQCERYFAEVRELLERQFQPRVPLNAAAGNWARHITASTDSVALHVRRGDYLTAINSTVHGVCDAAYYEAAARFVAARSGARRFFVFSDDIAWARDALRLPGATAHVDGNDDAPEVDLHLMSLCRHHVCANSSFSWWGAWLAQHRTQTVVAPRRWFASAALDDGDIVPSRWHCL